MTAKENIEFREKMVKNLFSEKLGYELNLENPKTFNEKIQWLKLYYHDPLMTKCADKYLAREYIEEKIGKENLVPLLGVWDKVEDIDFNSLPNKFVLKINYGSNQHIIVKDKSKLDVEEAKNRLNYFLRPFASHYYKAGYEWQYKNIPPKIICEKYIEQDDGNLYDYRIFCFNGEPHFIIVDIQGYILNSNEKYLRNVYSTNWEKLDIKMSYSNFDIDFKRPYFLDDMLRISKLLSKDFYHVRVDFYELKQKLFIGELTFTHLNGMGKFYPFEWDYKFGELLTLPKDKRIEYDFIDRDTLLREYLNLEQISYEYKKLEEDIILKNNELLSKNNELLYKDNIINKLNDEIYRLKEKEEQYNNLINKIAWWIPIKKWRDNFRKNINNK